MSAGFPRAGENGRLSLAVPSKGRMAAPALELCAAAGLSFEAGERSLLIPCRNAPVDLLLVRAHDIPEYVQDGVVHAGITGANLVAEAESDVVMVCELGFARCTLEAAVPMDAPQQTARRPLRPPRRHRVSALDPRGLRAPAHRCGARDRVGLGRGLAAARPLRRHRRPRLDGLDGDGERAAPDRQAARLAGRADRRRRRAPRERRAARAAAADAGRRRRGPPPALPDDERARGSARDDPRRSCRAWAPPRCSRSPSPARSRSTPPSTSTTSGTCCSRSRPRARPRSS